MTSEISPLKGFLILISGTMVLFAGLCTVFVMVVTAMQAVEEHAEAQWPSVTAHVDECGFDRTSYGQRNRYYVDCHLSYAMGAEQHKIRVYSQNVPSREVWQYPPNQIDRYEAWVDQHPAGTLMAVHYDPNNHGKAVLAGDYMPSGGPHTPNNFKLFFVCAAIFLVSLTGNRALRPAGGWQSLRSSTQLGQ